MFRRNNTEEASSNSNTTETLGEQALRALGEGHKEQVNLEEQVVRLTCAFRKKKRKDITGALVALRSKTKTLLKESSLDIEASVVVYLDLERVALSFEPDDDKIRLEVTEKGAYEYVEVEPRHFRKDTLLNARANKEYLPQVDGVYQLTFWEPSGMCIGDYRIDQIVGVVETRNSGCISAGSIRSGSHGGYVGLLDFVATAQVEEQVVV